MPACTGTRCCGTGLMHPLMLECPAAGGTAIPVVPDKAVAVGFKGVTEPVECTGSGHAVCAHVDGAELTACQQACPFCTVVHCSAPSPHLDSKWVLRALASGKKSSTVINRCGSSFHSSSASMCGTLSDGRTSTSVRDACKCEKLASLQ